VRTGDRGGFERVRRSATSASVAAEWRQIAACEPEEDLLQAAFGLAYFIHRDRRIAEEISLAAMRKLEVAATAQLRRLYYKGRGEPPSPFKASWADRHLLQRLVYFESESWERFGEERDPDSLTEEDLLLRFVKYLSQITMKRSSFYASIALGRIVHAYSTADTMSIYDAVAPEGCERKQGDYFRSRKAQLLEEVRGRFGGLLSIVRGPHREERIETSPLTPEKAAWMRECLRVTTPWATACAELEEIAAREKSRDLFDRQEVRRFHALFHPPCFSRLARTLRLPDPKTRLAVPHFRLAARPPSPRPPGPDDRFARLLPEEQHSIRGKLQEDSRRRRDVSPGMLRVLVDGKERARWDPLASHLTRFPVEEQAEIVEVRARTSEGDLLLAAHALAGERGHGNGDGIGLSRGPQAFSIVLESGQAIGFRVEGEDSLRTMELTYRETIPVRAALFGARRLARSGGRAARIAAAWAAQPIGIALLVGALALALSLGRGPIERHRVQAAAVAPSVAPPPEVAARVVQVPQRLASSQSPALQAPERITADTTIGQVQRRRGHRGANLAGLAPSLAPEPSFAFGPSSSRPVVGLSLAAQIPAAPAARISLDAETPLQAVRESFLQDLAADPASPTGRGEPRGQTRLSSNGIQRDLLRTAAQRDPRAAALSAALASSSSIAAELDQQPKLLDWKWSPDPQRVRILRRVVSPGASDARCRPQELACPVARISSAKVLDSNRGDKAGSTR
jgi:hypothetical protein